MMRRTMIVVVIMSLLVVSASVAVAAPRKNSTGGGSSSIWVDYSTLRSTDGYLHFQDQVGFGYATSYSATDGSGPWLELDCYQGGVLVFSDVRAGFPGGYGYGVPFQLGPSMAWSGGDADCTGTLFHVARRGHVTDATTGFQVKA